MIDWSETLCNNHMETPTISCCDSANKQVTCEHTPLLHVVFPYIQDGRLTRVGRGTRETVRRAAAAGEGMIIIIIINAVTG